ncbi:MAG: CsgG/HfaB family protein [Geminicoccaceae bacterium]
MAVCAGTLALTSCLGAGGSVTQGSGGTAVTGSAAGSTSVGADSGLERCSETLGTLAVDDGREQSWWGDFYARTQITSIEPMIRTLVQQSNCFVITSMGNERLNRRIQEIRDQTRNTGEFRAGSNYQKGQAIAADYFLEPTILFAASNAGGLGGALGGYLGSLGTAVGGALGNEKHTTVNLTLFGIREGAQIAASEGSASSNDLTAFVGGFFGDSVPAGLVGYTKTPEGKATVAAFVDAFNKMIVAVKNYQAQTVKGGLGRGGTMKFSN